MGSVVILEDWVVDFIVVLGHDDQGFLIESVFMSMIIPIIVQNIHTGIHRDHHPRDSVIFHGRFQRSTAPKGVPHDMYIVVVELDLVAQNSSQFLLIVQEIQSPFYAIYSFP